jgi:hypothetical protein
MSPSSFFNLINIFAGIAWLCLIALSPYWKSTDKFLISVIIVLLALVYTYLNFSHINEAGGPTGFLTFEGVARIFANPYLICAAWAHIIAFDIMVGIWIKNDAANNNINYQIVILVLLPTIVFAPLGLLIYLLVRWIKTKEYFVDAT